MDSLKSPHLNKLSSLITIIAHLVERTRKVQFNDIFLLNFNLQEITLLGAYSIILP